MNKLKYVVLFVVISSVFTFFIVYYNSLNTFEKIGYEIKTNNKTICSTCKNIVSLNDKVYYNLYSKLELYNNEGELIKRFDEVGSPRILYKSSDNNGVIVYYKDNIENQYFISKFKNNGEQVLIKHGPYKNIISNSINVQNNFYTVIAPDDAQFIVKFDDNGNEIFKEGPFYSTSILHETDDRVIIKSYDSVNKKYYITNYQINGQKNWEVNENNFYNVSTYENELIYFTLESDGKYIYKLNFDGTTLKAGPFDRKFDNNKLFKTSEGHYFIANSVDNQKVITIFNPDLTILKQVEGYNYSNITKSLDSDEFVFTNTEGTNISIVKLNQEGNEVFNKIINTSFSIKLFTSTELIYSVKVNNVDYNVYLDGNGNKKWETTDIFYGNIYNHNLEYNYLVRDNTSSNYTFKKINQEGNEIFTIGPANLLTRVAYFTNGDFMYYYKNKSNEETKVIIVNTEGETVFESTLNSTEDLEDRRLIYAGDKIIHINRNFLY